MHTDVIETDYQRESPIHILYNMLCYMHMYNSCEYLTRSTCIKAIIIGLNLTANHIIKLGYSQLLLQTLPVEYTIMETIKVVVVLTLATVAATIKVDPK